jgi:hypothetical protein
LTYVTGVSGSWPESTAMMFCAASWIIVVRVSIAELPR